MTGRPTLQLGALAPELSKQLTGQGMPFNAETMRHLERDAEAASRLKVRGLLTQAEGNRAYDRIAKKVFAEVKRALSRQAPEPVCEQREQAAPATDEHQ